MWKNLLRTTLIIALPTGVSTAAWSQEPDTPSTPLAKSIAVVDTVGRVGSHVAIAIGVDGLPLIAYHDETQGVLKVAKCRDSSCSGQVSITTVDDRDRVGSYAAIAIDRDGLPVISYFDAVTGDLKVARCAAPDCSGEATISTLDREGVVGTYTSIAIGKDGLPVVSYLDRDRCDLKVAKCKDPACTGSNVVVSTVDKKGCVGLFSSLAISADGTPLIAYYDSNRGRLKVAKCNDPACSVGKATVSVVDERLSAGSFAQVVIGADDLPLISYYDHSRGNLRVAHCNDSACTDSDESIVALDSEGLDGSFAALGFGADGLPLITYYGLTDGLVKLVRCTDATCSGFEPPKLLARDEEILKSFLTMAIGPDGTPVVAFFNTTDGDLKVMSVPVESLSP